jgi:hypothetical protein
MRSGVERVRRPTEPEVKPPGQRRMELPGSHVKAPATPAASGGEAPERRSDAQRT